MTVAAEVSAKSHTRKISKNTSWQYHGRSRTSFAYKSAKSEAFFVFSVDMSVLPWSGFVRLRLFMVLKSSGEKRWKCPIVCGCSLAS